MAGHSEDPVLAHRRALDEKLDRVCGGMGDLKVRMTDVEERLAKVELSIAGTNRFNGRVEVRLNRLERRLDLVETPP